jgi:tetratricopeptide (TPR) repeat protein
MKYLDCCEEIFEQSCLTIDPLENPKAQLPPHHPYKDFSDTSDLPQVQSAAREQLLVTLTEIKFLAAKVAKNGDSDAAECAYSRAVKAFGSPPFNTTAAYAELLREAGSFYMKNGDNLQAEKHLRQVLKLPHVSKEIMAGTLQDLTESIPASTKQIAQVFRSGEIGRVKPNVQVPFPELHRLMAAVPASAPSIAAAIMSLGCRTSDITHSPPIHSAILWKKGHALDMIRSYPHKELLESRDTYKRTALFLAAMYQQEEVALSIMTYFADQPGEAREVLMNARDMLGNTVLAVSIFSNCSTSFVEAAIENGSEVDPVQMEGGYTPLQAAEILGRGDVLEILQGHGAEDRGPLPSLVS